MRASGCACFLAHGAPGTATFLSPGRRRPTKLRKSAIRTRPVRIVLVAGMAKRASRRAAREEIVNAALTVVDRVGLEGLTIRAVAAVAGAPPMSLYAHFATKEQLLDLMHAGIAARLYADVEHTWWQAALAALCHQIRSVLLAHPRWIPLLDRPAVPVSAPLRERILALMISRGVSSSEALTCFMSAQLMCVGWTRLEVSLSSAHEAPAWMEPRPDFGQVFGTTVTALIDGLEARLAVGRESGTS